MEIETTENTEHDIFFEGFGWAIAQYPRQVYHKWLEPIIVKNEEEFEEAKLKGYGNPVSPITANKYLMNWRYDLEEMSARQLALYAKDEFDIDLPYEVGKHYLFNIIYRLYMSSPASRDRIAFLAQTVELDWDKVQDGLKEIGESLTDYESEEVWL